VSENGIGFVLRDRGVRAAAAGRNFGDFAIVEDGRAGFECEHSCQYQGTASILTNIGKLLIL